MSRSSWTKWIAFLYLLILLMPFSNFAHSILFALAIITSMASYRQITNIKWKSMNKPLIYIFLYFLSSIFFVSLFFDSAVMKETRRYLSWTLPFIPLMIFSIQQDIKKSWQWAAIIAGTVISIPVLYDKWILGVFRPGSFSINPNLTAMYLEYSIPMITAGLIHKGKNILENRVRHILAGIGLVVTVLAIIYGESRGGIIGLLLGGFTAFYMVLWHKWSAKLRKLSLIVIVAILALGGFLFPLVNQEVGRNYDNERLLLIESSYAMWKDHPIVGVGFSNWSAMYKSQYILPAAKEPNLNMPHNTIAFFFSTTGIIGGVAFLVLMGGTVIVLMYEYNLTRDNIYAYILWIFLASYIHGFVDSGLMDKDTLRNFSACYGVLVGYLYYKRRTASID